MARTKIHRTTVDLDVKALERAQEVLGTSTIRETIDKALHEVDRYEALRRGADLILQGGLALIEPEDLAALRKLRR
jgi:Arc/MetJ family transcription regulator